MTPEANSLLTLTWWLFQENHGNLLSCFTSYQGEVCAGNREAELLHSYTFLCLVVLGRGNWINTKVTGLTGLTLVNCHVLFTQSVLGSIYLALMNCEEKLNAGEVLLELTSAFNTISIWRPRDSSLYFTTHFISVWFGGNYMKVPVTGPSQF